MAAYAFHIAEEEEKELWIISRLSRDSVYSIPGIDSNSKLCSYHKSKTHNTVDYKTHVNRSKPITKYFICRDEDLAKDFPNSRNFNKDICPHSTTPYTWLLVLIPTFKMWQDIAEQLEELNLKNKKISKYVKTTCLLKDHSGSLNLNKHQKLKTVTFANDSTNSKTETDQPWREFINETEETLQEETEDETIHTDLNGIEQSSDDSDSWLDKDTPWSNKVVSLWNRTVVAFVDKLSSTIVDFMWTWWSPQ